MSASGEVGTPYTGTSGVGVERRSAAVELVVSAEKRSVIEQPFSSGKLAAVVCSMSWQQRCHCCFEGANLVGSSSYSLGVRRWVTGHSRFRFLFAGGCDCAFDCACGRLCVGCNCRGFVGLEDIPSPSAAQDGAEHQVVFLVLCRFVLRAVLLTCARARYTRRTGNQKGRDGQHTGKPGGRGARSRSAPDHNALRPGTNAVLCLCYAAFLV